MALVKEAMHAFLFSDGRWSAVLIGTFKECSRQIHIAMTQELPSNAAAPAQEAPEVLPPDAEAGPKEQPAVAAASTLVPPAAETAGSPAQPAEIPAETSSPPEPAQEIR